MNVQTRKEKSEEISRKEKKGKTRNNQGNQKKKVKG